MSSLLIPTCGLQVEVTTTKVVNFTRKKAPCTSIKHRAVDSCPFLPGTRANDVIPTSLFTRGIETFSRAATEQQQLVRRHLDGRREA